MKTQHCAWIALAFLFSVVSRGYGLDPIPLSTFDTTARRSSPIQVLRSIANDPRYVTCRKDLEHFVANLSPQDRKEIQLQAEEFKAEKLAAILKAKIPNETGTEIEIDDFMIRFRS